MKALIEGSLAESKRVTGLIKLIICMAVIIGLASTSSVFAVSTITLDGSEAWTGTPPGDMSLALTMPTDPINGTILFKGEIWEDTTDLDPDMVTAVAPDLLGNSFDILGPFDITGGDRTAEMFFDFDVLSIDFIYGGNYGTIYVEARAADGITVVDSLATQSTGAKMTATLLSPLSGSSPIRSLYWIDDFITPSTGVKDQNYAVLDNIVLTVNPIPAPGALMLAGIGVGCVSGLRKRKIA